MASAADQRETNGGNDSSPRPELVGVGVIVVRSDEVLFGLRRGAHRVDCAGGNSAVREPEACGRWSWFCWEAVLEPLFLPVASLRASGFRP